MIILVYCIFIFSIYDISLAFLQDKDLRGKSPFVEMQKQQKLHFQSEKNQNFSENVKLKKSNQTRFFLTSQHTKTRYLRDGVVHSRPQRDIEQESRNDLRMDGTYPLLPRNSVQKSNNDFKMDTKDWIHRRSIAQKSFYDLRKDGIHRYIRNSSEYSRNNPKIKNSAKILQELVNFSKKHRFPVGHKVNDFEIIDENKQMKYSRPDEERNPNNKNNLDITFVKNINNNLFPNTDRSYLSKKFVITSHRVQKRDQDFNAKSRSNVLPYSESNLNFPKTLNYNTLESMRNLNKSSATQLTSNPSEIYQKGLLFRKTSQVDYLVKNKKGVLKLLNSVLHGSLNSLLQNFNREPVTTLDDIDILDTYLRNPEKYNTLSMNQKTPSNFEVPNYEPNEQTHAENDKMYLTQQEEIYETSTVLSTNLDNEGQQTSENEGPQTSENGIQQISENEAQQISENEGQESSENEDQEASENEYQEALDNEGQETSENEGQEASENVGQEASENEDQEASENEYQEALENEGQETSENEGQDASENVGQEASENEGQESSENEGQETSENEDQQKSENEGQETLENEDQKTSENEGKGTLENKETSEDVGQQTLENQGQELSVSDSDTFPPSTSAMTTVSPENENATSSITGGVHIKIIEPFNESLPTISGTDSEADSSPVESNYNLKYPVVLPMDEEDTETNAKRIWMHIRPAHKTKIPEIRYKRKKYGRKSVDSPINKQTARVLTRKRRQIDVDKTRELPRTPSLLDLIDQQKRNVPFDECCYNGGTCVTSDKTDVAERTSMWCLCPSSFLGRFCEIDVNECSTRKPCKDHEVCINTYGSFSCVCEPDFVREGEDCIPKVTCEEFPCLNGAECNDSEDGHFKCRCPLGFLGNVCDIRVPECEDSSCSKDEMCVSTETGYRCVKSDEDEIENDEAL